MSHIDINDQSPIPILRGCIKWRNLPTSLSHLQNRIFITQLRIVSQANKGTDPLREICFMPPAQPCVPTPTTGCFILTLMGKWDDIEHWRYTKLKYKVSHLHDNNKNDKATFDASQEMGRHINACFTHPIAQEMINTANSGLPTSPNNIVFGLVIDVRNITTRSNTGDITYIEPSNPSKHHIISNANTSHINTPSCGWLCLFVVYDNNYWFHLPVVDLSSYTQFMKTYNPNDLPPTRAFAYNALIDKWKNEQCQKKLSDLMPKPNQLNPYTYVEAWNDSIKAYNDAKQKRKEEEIKAKEQQAKEQQAQQYFDEYKKLYLQQQTFDITSYIQQQQQMKKCEDNYTCSIDSSLISTLSSTLSSEYYAKYLYNQFNDLKIMNHLQYHQYQQLSDAKLRYPLHYGYIHNTPRKHIALPGSTSKSQIETLIELATTPSRQIHIEDDNDDDHIKDQQHQQSSNITTTTINRPSPENEHCNQQRQQEQQENLNLADSNIQYNTLLEQKHNLQTRHNELSTLSQYTIDHKNNDIQTLKEQIITLQQQMDILIQQHQDTIKQHQDSVKQLNEQHLKEKEVQCNNNTSGDNNNNTNTTHNNIIDDTIAFFKTQITTLQQQLDTKDTQYQKQLDIKDQQIKDIIQSKDRHITKLQEQHHQQLESKDQQIKQIVESKDKQLESKDQQIALLMQMLSNMTIPPK